MRQIPISLIRFVDEFNAAQFFKAHEVLEEAWRAQGGTHSFYKGLIQLAVACHHLKMQNFSGARQLLQSSKEYLKAFFPSPPLFNIQTLLSIIDKLEQYALKKEAPPSFPQIHFLGDSA